jgi:hypothetical protein
MGDGAKHPCRCGVPRTLRKLAAIYGDLLFDSEYPEEAPPLQGETSAPGDPA